MSGRSGLWVAASALFALANAVAAGYYGALGELAHAGGHVGLMVLGTWLAWWFAAPADAKAQGMLPPGDERLERLQQSMDAIALEVERISESQRFRAKVEAKQSEERR